MRNKVVSLLLFIVLMFTSVLHAEEQEDEKLTFLILPDYYPFTFTLPDGSPTGLYVEFWQLWSETNNVSITIESANLDVIKDRITSQENTFSNFFTSEERRAWADFALPFHAVQTGVMFNKQYDSDATLAELSGGKVAVLAGSHQEQYIKTNYPQLDLAPYTLTEKAIEDVINERIDAVVGEIPNLNTTLSRIGLAGVLQIAEVLYTETVHPIIGKDQPELLNLFNEGIKRIPLTDIIALEKKWLPTLKPFFENEQYLNELTIEERLWLQNHKQFKLGIDDNLPPFEFLNDKGKFSGIAADYLNHASEVLGVKFIPQKENTWLESFALLKEGKVDLMSAAIVTDERRKEMDFTAPYVAMSTAIVVRRNTLYVDNMTSLNNKILGLVEGDFVNFVLRDYPEIKIKIVSSEVEGLEILQDGLIDAFIAPIAVANYEIHKRDMNDLIIAAFAPYNLELTMAIRKGLEPLASILNKTFASMPKQQQSMIENTWLRAYVYSGLNTIDILKWVIPIVLLMLLTVILIISKSNKRLNLLLLKNKSLARRIVAIQEEERKLLSRDLHDEIGQNLTALQYHINAAKDSRDQTELHEMLNSIDEITAITYRSSYELMHWLRPMVLDDYGLEHALSNHIISKLLSESNIEYHQSFSGDFSGINDEISTNIYRIAQECITNAAKHSQAKNLWLTLSLKNECLKLTVRDDGIGFDVQAEFKRESGFGIEGIQDRLDAMEGTLELTSGSEGTRYKIILLV